MAEEDECAIDTAQEAELLAYLATLGAIPFCKVGSLRFADTILENRGAIFCVGELKLFNAPIMQREMTVPFFRIWIRQRCVDNAEDALCQANSWPIAFLGHHLHNRLVSGGQGYALQHQYTLSDYPGSWVHNGKTAGLEGTGCIPFG